ncbi:MAG: FGGY-family carbohydrate kinase [Deltaproteobacteria bacterium]|nr:FGGY-family carbohydrate kinase [Deltaproteobacteria bacterium]MBW2395831.1 FGGY-family carbohydrate kinase [Deltaproteobacteria bacterium]
MPVSQYILSIDLGTGGPKVSLVRDDGAIAAGTVRPVESLDMGGGGFEQDAEQVWSTIMSAAKQVVHEADIPAEAVLAVSCTSHYFSVVPIDEQGRPVSNMIPWMDSRGGAHTQALYERHPDAFFRWIEINGMLPLPTGSDSLSHMLFIQHERPDVYERTYKFVEPMDYVTTRLTGVCTANPCTAFAQLLTDNRRLDAVRYDDELLGFSGIDPDKLPDLVPVNACIGTLTREVAAQIGLLPETKVFAGMNDTHAVSIGTGVYQGRYGGINIGTTCQVLGFVNEKASDLEHSILTMPSPIPGRYAVMAECGLGAKPLEHFMTQVVFANDALADHGVEDPFANVEKALASVSPGSGGLLYLPWLAGVQSPRMSDAMRGGFLNFSLDTTRARMLRAVLEGVSFHLRWVLPEVEKFTGQEFGELNFAGGGAVSDEWSQMLADVMGRPVRQLAESRYVNNRATAFIAFEQLGIVSLNDIEQHCPIHRTYEPRPESQQTYERMFEQFVRAFEQNLPIFEALNA